MREKSKSFDDLVRENSIDIHVPPPSKRAEIILELAKMGRILAGAIDSPTAHVSISNNIFNEGAAGVSIDTIPNDVNDNDCHGGK